MKDHGRSKEKITKAWEIAAKRVYDEVFEATQENKKLKQELYKVKQKKSEFPMSTSNFDLQSDVSKNS